MAHGYISEGGPEGERLALGHLDGRLTPGGPHRLVALRVELL